MAALTYSVEKDTRKSQMKRHVASREHVQQTLGVKREEAAALMLGITTEKQLESVLSAKSKEALSKLLGPESQEG